MVKVTVPLTLEAMSEIGTFKMVSDASHPIVVPNITWRHDANDAPNWPLPSLTTPALSTHTSRGPPRKLWFWLASNLGLSCDGSALPRTMYATLAGSAAALTSWFVLANISFNTNEPFARCPASVAYRLARIALM